MDDSIAITLDRIKFYARDAVITLSQCICRPDATLKINGRSYKIERLLGEGGFSFVYLISDMSSGRLYALKKMLSTSGDEALKEVEAYRKFRHPNIIKVIDSAVVQAEEGRTVYIFLPYYANGNLQDKINEAAVSGRKMDETTLLKLFLGACQAVRAMHEYKASAYPPGVDAGPNVVPYAHRDIKPANIMIGDDQEAVLMDFGSTVKARVEVLTRQQALLEQDIASEHSSMPYRAPELFDVKTGQTLNEQVDIWSLGCTLYAAAYGNSPFEVDGASIAMAVASGRYKHPGGASEPLVHLIDALLVVDPKARPDIGQVIRLTEQTLEELEHGEGR